MNLWCCFIIFDYMLVSSIADKPPSCTTPNGEKALCVRTRSCSIFKEAFFSDDPLVQKFVDTSTSSCGDEGGMICCGTSASYTQNSYKKETIDLPLPLSKKLYAIKHLLPSRRICGMQHTDDYFYTENRTSIDEFPWLLGVYYNDRKTKRSPDPRPIPKFPVLSVSGDIRQLRLGLFPQVTYKCTGVLISNRYALTSGDCGSDEPMQVTLGQYDENKKVTCFETSFGEEDCTHPAINVTVEERIRSPNNSLALLRLEKKVQYTDFIRPICLPMNKTIRAKTDHIVFTSGWGYEKKADNIAIVKKRIGQNITNNEDCHENSSSECLCTMLESDTNYVCKSDRGGPLMYRFRNKNWYVEGIIDVKKGCVNDTVTSIKITPELVDWVLETMRD